MNFHLPLFSLWNCAMSQLALISTQFYSRNLTTNLNCQLYDRWLVKCSELWSTTCKNLTGTKLYHFQQSSFAFHTSLPDQPCEMWLPSWFWSAAHEITQRYHVTFFGTVNGSFGLESEEDDAFQIVHLFLMAVLRWTKMAAVAKKRPYLLFPK